MTYTVKYTRGFFTKTLKNVKGDGLLEGGTHRFFVCDDETRYEIPIAGTSFEFSSGRFLSIKQRMEREAGQVLPISTNLGK